jgi:hypothetical protein
MEKLPFPVFSLNNEADGKDLVHKARENKRLDSWPKWSAEFKAFMWGAGDSNICLRRGYCDPVGGQSVWGSFEEGACSLHFHRPFTSARALLTTHWSLLSGVDAERDIVLVMSQLDSNSIFQDLALGAEATASGITTLLTAIHALADQRKLEAQQGGIYIPPGALLHLCAHYTTCVADGCFPSARQTSVGVRLLDGGDVWLRG